MHLNTSVIVGMEEAGFGGTTLLDITSPMCPGSLRSDAVQLSNMITEVATEYNEGNPNVDEDTVKQDGVNRGRALQSSILGGYQEVEGHDGTPAKLVVKKVTHCVRLPVNPDTGKPFGVTTTNWQHNKYNQYPAQGTSQFHEVTGRLLFKVGTKTIGTATFPETRFYLSFSLQLIGEGDNTGHTPVKISNGHDDWQDKFAAKLGNLKLSGA